MAKSRMNLNQSVMFKNVVEEFLLTCKARNLSSYTIKFYESTYSHFTKFAGEIDIKDLNAKLIMEYQLYLIQKGVKDVSIDTYLRGLRGIINYCTKQGYMQKITIQMPKVVKEAKETYTDEELSILLKKPNIRECRFGEYRTWVIINFLLSTGCRCMTLRNIKIEDIDFENGYVTYKKTKNKRQQIVPLSSSIVMILKEYMKYRKGEKEEYLFCNYVGEQISQSGLNTSLDRYTKKRGISRKSIHAFRHTFAKLSIINGMGVMQLQKMLGHSSLDMVRHYVNLYSTDLRREVDLYNPLDRLVSKQEGIKMQP